MIGMSKRKILFSPNTVGLHSFEFYLIGDAQCQNVVMASAYLISGSPNYLRQRGEAARHIDTPPRAVMYL